LALKQEVAALQKKLNVLESQEKVDRAQQQAAIQSWETVTSGNDGKGSGSPWGKLYGVKLTFGGFIEAAGVWRDKTENTDFGNIFGKIPFDSTQQAHVNELRGTARQSRIQGLAEANISDHEKIAAFVAADFLGTGIISNSQESNSYSPRLREGYATYDDSRDGWHVLAGQSWSLVTMFKEGLIARKENVPLTIDAQYVPGFDWLRNPEIRIVKDWDKKWWFGLEAASPFGQEGGNQTIFTAASATGGGAAVSAINSFTCNSLLNTTASCPLDFMPDVTAKLAADPGWGHYEVFGLMRGFRDRISGPFPASFPVKGTASGPAENQNNYDVAFSGGGGMILPLVGDKLQLQANVLAGQGIGRYTSSQLSDYTLDSDGKVAPLTGYSIMAGLTSHNAIPNTDAYVYAGQDKLFNHVSGVTTPFVNGSAGGNIFGYGVNIDNSGCTVIGGTCTGTGQLASVWQVTGGLWNKLYDGDKGIMMWGPQYSFTVDQTFDTNVPGKSGLGGSPHADEQMVYMSFRYYPKFGTLIGTKP
jgi:hypothetical protein